MRFKNILKVYKRDWKSIIRNPIAILIITGVCVLPSLYAWVNIVACWNIYENTGTIPVAIVNNDKEASFNDKKIHIGDDVIKALKGNHNIKWSFINSKQAELGLVDGTYFAVIEIPRNFSSNFLSVLSEHPQKPYIIYKVDTKINPVAIKITDSAKNSLVQQIKINFVSTVNETLFSSLNVIGKDADNNKENLLQFKDSIITVNRNIGVIQNSLESIKTNSDNINQFLIDIDAVMPSIQNSLSAIGQGNLNKQRILSSTQATMNNSINNIDTNLNYAQASNDRINALFNNINKATGEGVDQKTNAVLPSINQELDSLNNAITASIDYLTILNSTNRDEAIGTEIASLQKLQTALNDQKKKLITLQEDLVKFKGPAEELNHFLTPKISNLEKGIAAVDRTREVSIAQLENLNATLNNQHLTQFINQLKAVSSSTLKVGIDDAIEKSKHAGEDTKAIVGTLNTNINEAIRVIDDTNAKIDTSIKFLESVRSKNGERKNRVADIIKSLQNTQPYILDQKNQFSTIQRQLNDSNAINKNIVNAINNDSNKIASQLNHAMKQYNSGVKNDLNAIGNNLIVATEDASDMIKSVEGLNKQITQSLELAQEGSALSSEFSGDLKNKLVEFKTVIGSLGNKLEMVDNTDLALIITLLESNPQFMGDFMSDPFELKTESIYSIPNYGSSMAPIYTTLALWVGCMILNSILKAKVGYFEGVEQLTAKERHFGKMMIFCTLAMIQGLIVSVGNIALLKIYVVDASLFITFSVLSSLVFSIITFTLMSTMGNLGKALSIIYMILQLVGSGGTYPVQVDPVIFRILQPLCPFTYTVGGLREAVAGPLSNSVMDNFVGLFVFGTIFLLFGYFFIERLNPWVQRFERKLKQSGIGE